MRLLKICVGMGTLLDRAHAVTLFELTARGCPIFAAVCVIEQAWRGKEPLPDVGICWNPASGTWRVLEEVQQDKFASVASGLQGVLSGRQVRRLPEELQAVRVIDLRSNCRLVLRTYFRAFAAR